MKNTFLVAALTSTIVFTAVSPALAYNAQESTLRGVRSNTSDIKSNTSRTVSELRDLRNDAREQSRVLMQALRAQTGEQSAYADKQIEAFKRIQDAGQQNDTDRVRQQIRAAAESGQFDPNPDACLLIDLYGNSDVTPSGAQGTAVIARAAAEKIEIGRMGAAGAARTMADKEVMINGKDATVRASSFLEVPSINMNDEEMSQAAADFLLKMQDPSPMQPIPSTAQGLDAELAAAQETRKNCDSIVSENWALLNNMSSTVVSGDELRKWAEGTPYNRDIPEDASELQAIDVMTVRHYAPPASESVGTVKTGVVLQKIHQLTAIMARMQYMQLEMDRRNLLTQSAILAKMIENDGE